MAYTQTVIDTFTGTTLDTSRWNTPDGTTGLTQNGTLNLAAVGAYPGVDEKVFTRNLATGILAVKLSSTGTATGATEYYIGVLDSAGNRISVQSTPINGYWTLQAAGSATISNILPAGSNFWSALTAGQWVGLGNIGSDNIIHFCKSADGQTWTDIGYGTVGGTFTKTACGLTLQTGVYSSTSTWVSVHDDYSYWAAATTGQVRVGGAWVHPTSVKVRQGGAWVTPTAIKVRQGGAWVTPTA